MLSLYDKIVVMDGGCCYGRYEKWAKKYNLNWNKKFSRCHRGETGYIIAIGRHSVRDGSIVYGIRSEKTGYDFMIGIEGIRKIGKKYFLDEGLFEI